MMKPQGTLGPSCGRDRQHKEESSGSGGDRVFQMSPLLLGCMAVWFWSTNPHMVQTRAGTGQALDHRMGRPSQPTAFGGFPHPALRSFMLESGLHSCEPACTPVAGGGGHCTP